METGGKKKHLIVIGGGAAGIFCAVNAARMAPGLRVTVLEKTGKLLSKVKVSGGGRCNVTHACFDIDEMAGRYPRGRHYVRKAFHRWFTTDTIEWFRQRGVELKAEEDGRMFPVTDLSQTIIDCLMREVNTFGVDVRMHAEVKRVAPAGVGAAGGQGLAVSGAGFSVEMADGRMLAADFVCIACGGYPKPGMFDWIRELGHSVEEPVPSLFTFNMPGDPIVGLMGVSVPEVQVKIAGSKLMEKGPVLITHWGLSGPAVLRLSAWGARELAGLGYQFTIVVNFLPEFSEQELRDRLQELRYEWASKKLGSASPLGLPRRLWDHWLGISGVDKDLRWADLPVRDQNRLAGLLCAGTFMVNGKTTFKEEFVTAGGVRLAEVDPGSCQSRKVPGLYFAGEILDVDGITGGFNFQHAWTSGWVVAASVAGAAGGGE
ncbi:NAD(P)/FAD-dependent oxidoreductase [Puia dinghuensis]|uniref:Flavoprotein n=1 Tax=Puia dinghuensis TaxID=1792502 RepID=A0A8J2UL24_9BACT|nr:NAD(P)/FAD-dependent oxidoreductase [Puia dinghuensis]GGB26032.1 flavoprotein [Puia dinghuensis]